MTAEAISIWFQTQTFSFQTILKNHQLARSDKLDSDQNDGNPCQSKMSLLSETSDSQKTSKLSDHYSFCIPAFSVA